MANNLPLSSVDAASWAAGQSVLQSPSRDAGTAAAAANAVKPANAADIRAKKAGQQFEAMYLRQMLDEFMPKDSDTLFGKGTSGTMWRSMLVDSLATTLSKSGTIGLAQMVVKAETSRPKENK